MEYSAYPFQPFSHVNVVKAPKMSRCAFNLYSNSLSASYTPHDTDSVLFLPQYIEDEAQTALFKDSSYRAVNTFLLGYKNQSVYDVSGTSRCLFSDKYKTHKYGVGRAYNC